MSERLGHTFGFNPPNQTSAINNKCFLKTAIAYTPLAATTCTIFPEERWLGHNTETEIRQDLPSPCSDVV